MLLIETLSAGDVAGIENAVSSGAVVSGIMLFTITPIVAWPILPFASYAFAFNVTSPFEVLLVSQLYLYGGKFTTALSTLFS
ncbi:hypothetical protein OR1_04133 [Geobacter sp. OR-1]|nr:hypothetical protein OR1_04133 [Geobacter sp. OR-1]